MTPQPNICLITNRGTTIPSALQSLEVAWEGNGLTSIYCIRHVSSNFNKQFKNAELKTHLLNMGTYINYFQFSNAIKHCYFLISNLSQVMK